jgi:hypothetical protein
MFHHRCEFESYSHLRFLETVRQKLRSRLFIAQRQRNKALCIQLQNEIANLR